MKHASSFAHFTDTALIAEVGRLAMQERQATAHLIASLAEFDRRRLHLVLGYSSLFDYCVKALKLTEHEALNRIEVARAVRRFPQLLDRLASGALSLTAIRLLAPQMTSANVPTLLKEAEGQTKEGIKLILAKLNPQPPVPSVVRKLPEPRPGASARPSESDVDPPVSSSDLVATPVSIPAPASHRPVVAPLSEAQYKLQVTISAPARERLRAIQDLMRHRLPSGDPAAIVEHAFEVLHAELLKQKAAQVARPRAPRKDADARGRHIPAAVKRAVFRRDGGRCAFVAPDGTRCGSTSGVEFHHVQPFARAGDTTVENLEMRCRTHNGFEWTRQLEAEDAAATAP